MRLLHLTLLVAVVTIACSSPATVNSGNAATDAQAVAAPAGGTAAALADLARDWREQKDLTVQLADAMPEELFGYRPTPAQRTYGEQILHVATGNVELMKLLGDGETDPPFTIEEAEAFATKAEIVGLAGARRHVLNLSRARLAAVEPGER